jgi:uncharacterized membrane protein YidH (DUF202 family)
MSDPTVTPSPTRPERLRPQPVPAIPDLSRAKPDDASVGYSHYRTTLSNHRTGLSEHRTDLSEFRTDLSGERTEMSMRRTGMSFQRTRMSADRTLMSVIRTSLSLIGFGFTIYQAFEKLRDAAVIQSAAAPRNFGLILILLGMLILVGGIVQHAQFARGLRRTRGEMKAGGLIHGESKFPISAPFVVAVILLVVGLVAALSIVFRVSLFG